MSAEQTADIYQPINQAAGSSTSKTAADVVIDNLSNILGQTEAETIFATRAKGRPMILDNPQKESRTRLIRKSKASRQQEDKRSRKQNLQTGKERLAPKAAVKGLK
jgi:hypothetical protein